MEEAKKAASAETKAERRARKRAERAERRAKKEKGSFWKDFKAFISRGNIIDLAVGLVIGAAFTAIVNSVVNDIIKPLIALLVGNNFSELVVVLRPETTKIVEGVEVVTEAITLNYGNLIMAVLTFLIDGIAGYSPLAIFAVVLVCVGAIGLGVVEAREDEALRIERQKASNYKYAKSFMALAMPVAYCILDAAGTFADTRVLEILSRTVEDYEASANVAYELTFLAAGVLCFIYVVLIKKDRLVPKMEGPKYLGAVCETAGQFAYIYAIADQEHVAMSAPIIASYCAASVLWSRLFLQEKLSSKHYLMILLVVIGIAIMGFFDI